MASIQQMQARLDGVRKELAEMTKALSYAERRLRHELQEELAMRLNISEDRCAERVDFMRRRTERHVEQIRSASHTRVRSYLNQQEHQMAVARGAMEEAKEEIRQAAQAKVEQATAKGAAQELQVGGWAATAARSRASPQTRSSRRQMGLARCGRPPR